MDPSGRWGRPRPSVQFLSFPFAKILPNNRFLPQTQGLVPPSGKSWIRNAEVSCWVQISQFCVQIHKKVINRCRGAINLVYHLHKETSTLKYTISLCRFQSRHVQHVIFSVDIVSVQTDKHAVYHSLQRHFGIFVVF